jgi:hypothetical protein
MKLTSMKVSTYQLTFLRKFRNYLFHDSEVTAAPKSAKRARGPGGPGGPGGLGRPYITPSDPEETTPAEPEVVPVTPPSPPSAAAPYNDDPSANLSIDEPPPSPKSSSARGPGGGPGGPGGGSGPVNTLTNAQADYMIKLTQELQKLKPFETSAGKVERALPPGRTPPGPVGPGGPGGPGGAKAGKGWFTNLINKIFYNSTPKCCCLWYTFKIYWTSTVCLKWC